jgi:hypothetical protein
MTHAFTSTTTRTHTATYLTDVIMGAIADKTSGTSDAEFTASRARLARFRAKLDRVPVGTTFRLFCTFNGPHTPQPGWSPEPGPALRDFGPSTTAPSAGHPTDPHPCAISTADIGG